MKHNGEDRAAILEILTPREALAVQLAWERSDTVRFLLRCKKGVVLRHALKHPSFVPALVRWWWVQRRLERSLRRHEP